MSALRFYLAGDPPTVGCVRLKRTRRGRILIFAPDEMREFEERFRTQATLAMQLAAVTPLRGCVSLAVSALRARGDQRDTKTCNDGHRHRTPSDGDLLVAVSKALIGVAYERGDQIVRASVEGFVARPGEAGGVEVLVSNLHEEGA